MPLSQSLGRASVGAEGADSASRECLNREVGVGVGDSGHPGAPGTRARAEVPSENKVRACRRPHIPAWIVAGLSSFRHRCRADARREEEHRVWTLDAT